MMNTKILNTISQYNMINTGDTVAVCLSGGADSMALFHFLCSQRENLGIQLIALHINHGLRRESEEEEAFVRSYCASMGVECFVKHLEMNSAPRPKGMSVETRARELRYSFFFEKAKEHGAVLATAHTASDRAETVLFNITRGTSLKGAAGIPPVRDNIIRPLIDCTREEIENYCETNSIPYVTDKTNFEDIYSRNKIRLRAVPVLKEINPAFEKAVGDFAKENLEVYTLLTQLSDNLYRKSLGVNGLDVNILLSEHPAVIKNLLRNQLDRLGCLSKDNINLIYGALGQGDFKHQLSRNTFCRIRDGWLYFYTPKPAVQAEKHRPQPVVVDGFTEFAGSYFEISVISAENFKKIKESDKNYLTYCVNYDKIKGILKLRTRQSGDKITLPERKVTKTLKKLFTEDKVPLRRRDTLAVLTDDTDSVLWLADYGTNKPYVPGKNTEKVLLIKQM